GRGDWLRARRPFTQELRHELSFLHWVAAGVVWRELWRLLVGEEIATASGSWSLNSLSFTFSVHSMRSLC
ncbi:hypothetical protein GBAR_LOCUS2742, partial [Geodia barretti]